MTPHDDIRDIDRALTEARKARRELVEREAFHIAKAAECATRDAHLAAQIDALLDQRVDAMLQAMT